MVLVFVARRTVFFFFFFFNDTATTEIYTLSLHDALPISRRARRRISLERPVTGFCRAGASPAERANGDRKSTRLNSSHSQISYAVFCLKKKKKKKANSIALQLNRAPNTDTPELRVSIVSV